jgi:mercuric ion transport protein
MVRSYARIALPWVAWLFVACVVIQVFLAGLGVFDSPLRFIAHRDFGYMFFWLLVVLLVLAIAGRVGRRLIGLSALLIVLFILQSVFVGFRATQPMLAALHPVNGFLIGLVAIVVARDGRRLAASRPLRRSATRSAAPDEVEAPA